MQLVTYAGNFFFKLFFDVWMTNHNSLKMTIYISIKKSSFGNYNFIGIIQIS